MKLCAVERIHHLQQLVRSRWPVNSQARVGEIIEVFPSVEVAESSGTIICVRSDTESWIGHEAIAALTVLGAGFGLRRDVILAAGLTEWVPSDCVQLVVRGADNADLAANVLALIGRQPVAVPPSGTSRQRVVGALPRPLRTPVSDAIRQGGRALLSAEPGYGKSTLLDQVAEQLDYPTAWITLEANWSAADVIERLVATVGQYVPAFGWNALAEVRRTRQAAEEVGDRTPLRQAPIPEQLAELLVNVDAAQNEPVLLVVDDVHRATNDGARLLARLTAVGPSWLRIAFAGRGAPGAIRSAAASGHLPSWSAEELRFSRDEARTYLQRIVRELDDERADLLYERTEGWPAALAVIGAWLSAHANAALETLREMTRGDRHQIYRVFATEYFVNLPESIQEDLLTISLPSQLDVAIAQHLLGEDGGLRLRTLVDGPYFLTEDDAGTFRLHSLFREFLGQRWIDMRGRSSLKTARSSLARWYQDAGDAAAAYQVACEGEDWEIAVAAIAPTARLLSNQGDVGFLRELLDPIPPEQIRGNRPVWESWVRALAYTGAANALEEARALAAAAAPTTIEQALADLVLVELEHDLGELTDHEMALECDAIAVRISNDDLGLSLHARLLSLGARAARSADPHQWPGLRDEALQLTNEAETGHALAVAAVACATAADLANRIVQTDLSSEIADLHMLDSLRAELPLPMRIQQAKQFIALSHGVIDLYRRAFHLAEVADAPIVQAQVQISYARFLTFNAAQSVWRSGCLDDDARGQIETAVGQAVGAAHAYSRFGIPRSVVIALNTAAEAASVLDDRARVDELVGEALRIANQFGYTDLAENAIRVREEPGVLEQYRRAQTPPSLNHLSPAELDEYVEALIQVTHLSPSDAERVRPLLRHEAADLATLDAHREKECQYLLLLQDYSPPRIGPFLSELKWSVTCRMRGISSLSRGSHAEPLLQEFAAEVCSTCEFRAPGLVTGTNPSNADEAIYAPLLERFALR